jgi:hypothetical protein
MREDLWLNKVVKELEGYTMVVAYSQSQAEKIAATLDDDQFAPSVEYSATEIKDAADIPDDWRDLCPWPEHGSTYLEEDITCEEALATARFGYSRLSLLSLRCGHIRQSQPSLRRIRRQEQELRPFCYRCSDELFADKPTEEV